MKIAPPFRLLFFIFSIFSNFEAPASNEDIPPEFKLNPGSELNLKIDPFQPLKPVNRQLTGISFHRVSGWAGYPYSESGEYALSASDEERIRDLKLPLTRFYALGDENYPEANPDRGAAPSLENAIDRVASLSLKLNIPQETIALELENQGSNTTLPPEVWKRAIAYSLAKGYKFRFWEIGNEPYKANSVFTHFPEDYLTHFKEVSNAIREIQPDAKMILSVKRDDRRGSKQVISGAKGYYDFVAPHWYSYVSDNFEETVLGENAEILSRIKSLNDFLSNENPDKTVGQFDTEWGLSSKREDGGDAITNPRNSNIQGTVFRAIRLIYYILENPLSFASTWEMVVNPPKYGYCTFAANTPLQTGMQYWLFYYFNRHLGNSIASVNGTAPFYTILRAPTQAGKSVPATPCLITVSEDGKTLNAIIANGTWSNSYPVVLDILKSTVSEVSGVYLSSDDLDAPPMVNAPSDFVHPLTISAISPALKFILPPHSICFLKIELAERTEEIVSLGTSKEEYRTGEEMNLKTLLSGKGEGTLQIYLDDGEALIFEQTVSLNGLKEYNIPLASEGLIGSHTFKAVFMMNNRHEKSVTLNLVEANPPETFFFVLGPMYFSSGTTYINFLSRILISSTDDSGISLIEYRSDTEPWHPYDTPLEPGIFTENSDWITLYARATDIHGNVEAEKQFSYFFDSTPPSTTPEVEEHENYDVTLNAADDGCGVKETFYSLDDGPVTSGHTLQIERSGLHQLSYWSVDWLENEEAPKTRVFHDLTPPVTRSNYPDSDQWNKTPVTVYLSAVDKEGSPTSTYFILDGGNETKGDTVVISESGIHTLQFWSVDLSGNVESIQSTRIKIDLTPPVLSVTSPLSSYVYKHGETIPIQYEASDDLSGIKQTRVFINGSSEITGLSSYTLKTGDTFFLIQSTDQAGNASEKAIPFTVQGDGTAPVTKSNFTQSGMWIRKTAAIRLSTTDEGGSGVKKTYYQIDSNQAVNGTNFSISAEGIHEVYFWSEDNAGNIEARNWIQVRIDKTPPLITIFSPVMNGTYKKGQTIPISYSPADNLSGVESVLLVRNGNTDITGQSSMIAQFKDSYIYFKVTDNSGNATAKKVYFKVSK